ncbi:MAG: hypothetical protein U5Q44_05105 [Dehalococcoidia bacterium]|nr:hypothetical protein [Dehalococcoidia bacterium]
MAALLGDGAPSVDEVSDVFARHFAQVFNCKLTAATLPSMANER